MSEYARVDVHIRYTPEIADDPEAYEGETELEAKLAKEKAYIEEGGDYLFSALSHMPHNVVARVRPLHERHTEGETLIGKPMRVIWESEFSEFVSKVYGRPYRFQQQGDMMGQNTYWDFTVPIADTMEWDGQPLPTFAEWSTVDATEPERVAGDFSLTVLSWRLHWERDYWPQPEAVINDLHQRGLIEPGEYTLHVYW